jgi:hypothetical protein
MRTTTVLVVAATLLGCAAQPTTVERAPSAAELGEPSDDIDPAIIGAAVRENPGKFRHCYESARMSNPSLSGLVEVRLLVNPDGTIRHAAVADTNLPAGVVDCVVSAFYDLQLPAQEAATVAQYPMYFQPG